MLRAAGIPLEIAPADIDERGIEEQRGCSARRKTLPRLLAREKASAVAASRARPAGARRRSDAGARRAAFSKPADRAEAREQLRALRGQDARASLGGRGHARRRRCCSSMCDSARLTMRSFSDEFLEAYLDAAGAAASASVGGYQLGETRHPSVRARRGRSFHHSRPAAAAAACVFAAGAADYLWRISESDCRQPQAVAVSRPAWRDARCSSSASPARSAWASRPRRGFFARQACRCMTPTRWCTGSMKARRSRRSRQRFPARRPTARSIASKLGRRVVGDPDAIKRLEAIVHPLVREAETRFLAEPRARGAPVAVLDIPLLFETGGETASMRSWWSRRRRRCSASAC